MFVFKLSRAIIIIFLFDFRSICSDLVYVILFPQLLMVVHFKSYCNTYGSLAAYIVACIFRLGGGEDVLGLPAYIHYPGWDDNLQVQRFPFRTFSMLLSLTTLICVSAYSKYVFNVYIIQ